MENDDKLIKRTFEQDEIFEEIPGDPENILMKIPDEVLEKMGWKEGDTLKVTSENGKITITKV